MGLLEDKVYKLLLEKKEYNKQIGLLQEKIKGIDSECNDLLDKCDAELIKCERCQGRGFTVTTSGYGGVNTDTDDCVVCKATGFKIKGYGK